jgi:hypothetical protein
MTLCVERRSEAKEKGVGWRKLGRTGSTVGDHALGADDLRSAQRLV